MENKPKNLHVSNKKTSFVIVLHLNDGLNFYAGKVKWMGHIVDTVDTDFRFAKVFDTKIDAKKKASILKRSKGFEACKVKDAQRFLHLLKQ